MSLRKRLKLLARTARFSVSGHIGMESSACCWILPCLLQLATLALSVHPSSCFILNSRIGYFPACRCGLRDMLVREPYYCAVTAIEFAIWLACAREKTSPLMRLREAMSDFQRRREAMGQFLFPNAGCIFKNDYRTGTPSGKIIESCGLKGMRIGDAEVFPRHANFIVNRGAASARDVLALIRSVEQVVQDRTGLELEREIQLLGRWGDVSAVQLGG